MIDNLRLAFFRLAASGWIPANWFEPDFISESDRQAKNGRLKLEIVSHCWNYSHFLVYQLSSLVQFPPAQMDVTMTVFYCPEDEKTSQLLLFFARQNIPNVTWNWRPLTRPRLFRRGIGRNMAALETTADWVWFTDCDLMFRDDCLDKLSDLLQNKRDALFFPEEERTTELLAEDNPMLQVGSGKPQVLNLDTTFFTARKISKATGPLQIAHGDVCRATGYCRSIGLYQQPSQTWCKAHEDRAFRWLLRSQGKPLPIPGVYRIRHISKGRYTGSLIENYLRTLLRRFQSWLRKTV